MANIFKKPAAASAPALSFSLRDTDPDYDKLAQKCDELRSAIGKLDAETADLWNRQHVKSAKDRDRHVNSRVMALLGDDVPEAEDPLSAGVSARMREIDAERRDTASALEIARTRLSKARFAASKTICDSVKAEYTKRVRVLADALIAADSANAELAAITGAMSDADVAFTAHLPAVPARMLGEPRDRNNKVALWLREAARDGLIDRTTIPERLTP
jgi:hypothetical protein